MPVAPDKRTIEFAMRAPATSGGNLIREARLRTGLSQSGLARRLQTSQSLVARWEADAVSPGFETVVKAVRACGLNLSLGLAAYDADHDILIDEQLQLSPEARARRMVEHVRNVQGLQRKAVRSR
ncbi:MAG: helix-turn-helix domain-containing protein [Actinomycetota bacterium]